MHHEDENSDSQLLACGMAYGYIIEGRFIKLVLLSFSQDKF